MITSTISETKNHLSELLERVQAGETLIILDRKTPVARVERIVAPHNNPVLSQPECPWNPEAVLRLPAGQADGSLAAVVREERDGRP